jgi:hypothetical protein
MKTRGTRNAVDAVTVAGFAWRHRFDLQMGGKGLFGSTNSVDYVW